MKSFAVVGKQPRVTGVNELLSDVVADGVRGYGDLFESKSGDDVLDVERLAFNFVGDAAGNIVQVTAVNIFAGQEIAGEATGIVVDEFSEFESGVDFFEIAEDGFPAGFWLLQHFAKDLSFTGASFAGLEDGL